MEDDFCRPGDGGIDSVDVRHEWSDRDCEGGFLGIGGTLVSEAENSAVSELASALEVSSSS